MVAKIKLKKITILFPTLNISITSKQIMKYFHKKHAYKSLEHNNVKGSLSLSLTLGALPQRGLQTYFFKLFISDFTDSVINDIKQKSD